jgi:hypothetical protein
MRATTQGSIDLLKSRDCNSWQRALEEYSGSLKFIANEKKLGTKLEELDAWLHGEYIVTVKSRSPPHIMIEDLRKVMQWKLGKGKDRPMLMGLVNQNTNASVIAASTKSFALAGDGKWKESIQAMTELKGVGPATASAILSPLYPSLFVFMADEVLEAATNNKRTYTLSAYETMRAAIERVRLDLSGDWCLSDVGKALWARGVAAYMPVSPPQTIRSCNSTASRRIHSADTEANEEAVGKKRKR